jgi:outer membrane protein assembly factor BamD (BamD/ComL family)
MNKKIYLFAILMVASSTLFADSNRASDEYQAGQKCLNKGDYREAATHFKAAELYADDSVVKVNAINFTLNSYKKAKLYYQEFKEIEKLLNKYSDMIKYADLVKREFEIADKYFAGYREKKFSLFPWISGDDKTLEIYEAAISHAPFAEGTDLVKLRLGRIYLDKVENDKAVEMFKSAATQYPKGKVQRFAYMEWINVLVQTVKRADGDGDTAKKAVKLLNEYINRYDDPESIVWAEKALQTVKENEAKRLLNIGAYYRRTNNQDAAKDYLQAVIEEFPDTESFDSAEEMLTTVDKDFAAKKIREQEEEQAKEELAEKQISEGVKGAEKYESEAKLKYNNKVSKLKRELKALLSVKELKPMPVVIDVVPENSKGKWLLPIKKKDDRAKYVDREEELKEQWQAALGDEKTEEIDKKKLISKNYKKIISLTKDLDTAKEKYEGLVEDNISTIDILKETFAKRKKIYSDIPNKDKEIANKKAEIEKLITANNELFKNVKNVDETPIPGLVENINSLVRQRVFLENKQKNIMDGAKHEFSILKKVDVEKKDASSSIGKLKYKLKNVPEKLDLEDVEQVSTHLGLLQSNQSVYSELVELQSKVFGISKEQKKHEDALVKLFTDYIQNSSQLKSYLEKELKMRENLNSMLQKYNKNK